MKKILSWIYAIKTDKLLHFVCGMIIAQVLCMLLTHACRGWMPLLGAFLLASLIAASKEIVDIKYGVPSWKDLLASMIGIVVGLAILLI